MKKFIVLSSIILKYSLYMAYATPSTQIWNPSTDIQAYKTCHIGIDNYFSIFDNDTKPYASGTLLGLTYGAIKNVEIGVDLLEPSSNPLFLNFKYGVCEDKVKPAFAFGVFNAGMKKDVNDYNIFYGVTSKTFDYPGRFSIGYYSGNEKLLVDENNEKANTGIIASWDKLLNNKVWMSVDYSSGNSFYGAFSFGCSYLFNSNISMIFGYIIYNNDRVNLNNQFSTQLDINF